MTEIDHRLDSATFSLRDISLAAATDESTLKNWIAREIIRMRKHDRPAGTQGRPNLFTLRRAYQIVLTAQLVNLGLPVKEAAPAAYQFTDRDDGNEDFAPVGNPLSAPSPRKAGHLYSGKGVHTLLVIQSDKVSVVPIEYDTPVGALFHASAKPTIYFNVTDTIAAFEQKLRAASTEWVE